MTYDAPLKRTVLRFYLFNVAMFGVGVSWIFVSINVYGGASYLLAGFLVTLFVLAWSLVCLPQAWVYVVWLRNSPLSAVLAFCGLWVLEEWLRGWFLTGFPWLFLGYGVMETPLAGFAPVTGIFGLSFVTCLIGVTLWIAFKFRRPVVLIVPALTMLLSLLLQQVSFTKSVREISVSLVQGNVDQHAKWLASNRLPILNRYLTATESEWGRDLIIWPEAAITIFHDQAREILVQIGSRTEGSTLVTGIPDLSEDGQFQNTVIALGAGEGQYIKRRLVPFGEYVPLESVLRGIIRFFDLPMSRNVTGPWQQTPLMAGDLRLSTSICYEVVYPDLVRETTPSPDLFVTVSNDTWFGRSIGPWQHLQIARLRAAENGRGLVRATNNGITAIIDYRGELVASLPQFEQGVLRGDVDIRTGMTPFARFGSYPILILSLLLVAVGFCIRPSVA
ncbi:MAG: apolipoprotein N-acyltransferase [Gammaproteobacteria bacterium]|nr:apolipoprotein N-acyltransferase [Gammaproteobacteria bacterium]